MTIRSGTVYLVGAGPGDPSLITVRGAELLQRADVIVHDELIAHELLASARRDAEIIDAGKGDGWARLTQVQTNAAIVDRARSGRAVVRLKGGDPYLFGRGWEELEACRAAGIPCEVVPGVSSAIAAPARAGIPVTNRGMSRRVAIVTGRSDAAGHDHPPDLASVANADTLVVLMGIRALPGVVRSLIDAGRDPDTPVSIVERGAQPGQRRLDATLATVVERADAEEIHPPAVIVVGEVAALERPAGPLSGRRVVVTRPADASHELVDRLRSLGAEPIHAPLIRIDPVEPDQGWSARLGSFDWVVATSRHGARGLARELRRAGRDARSLAGARVAAVGPTTARELEAGGIVPDLVPDVRRASGLIRSIVSTSPPGARVLFPCGTLARDELAAGLRAGGLVVEPLIVYRTTLLAPDDRVRRQLERGVDAVLFASPSAVRAWVEAGIAAPNARFVCIGPTTGAEAERLGLDGPVNAADHSDAGLVDSTIAALEPWKESVA